MTKEELEKEAEEWIKDHSGLIGSYKFVKFDYDSMQKSYLAGAEPREKQIAKLESTNKKISDECHKLVDTLERKQKRIAELEKSCDETQELLDKQIEATYKLDKENAELKKENEEMKKDLGCETCQIHLEYKSLNNRIANLERENTELKAGRDINVFTKQLTKAKEIIKKLYSHVFQGMGFMELNDYNVQKAEAEQFLSEVEK